MKGKLFRAILVLLSFLATVKLCIISIGIDEEYAVTMAYRITAGDRMFLEIWEPHQTSGFLAAFLIRIFMTVTGTVEYLILFLRVAGACIQAVISLFLYRTLRKSFSEEAAFVASVFFYNTLPKWIQTPEFANMLVWFATLAFGCFLRYYLLSQRRWLWLVAAGICLSAMVLSYPSCVLAMPVILLGMWKLREGNGKSGFLKEAAILFGTCLLLGFCYVGYFLGQMSAKEFVYGFTQMMTDCSHSAGIFQRLADYGQELVRLLLFAAAAVLPAALLVLAVKKLRTLRSFVLIVMIVTLIEQVVYWICDSRYLQEPLIYFYFLFLCGVILYTSQRKRNGEASIHIRALFWLGSVGGAGIWSSALLITNTTISVTGSYLMPGLICGILLLWDDLPQWGQKYLLKGFTLCLLGTTLFVKGFLVCSTEGVKDNVTFVKQKALSGPAKGIYCRYVDGYVYNVAAELLSQYTKEECPVLYVGEHSLYYLLGSQTISNFSTISTPTYNERLGEYWEQYPDRIPKLVICDTDEDKMHAIKEILVWGPLIAEQELLENMHSFRIYEVTGRRE